MRVISGFLKGKKLLGYDVETTRPTMDRVKESIFDSIQNNLSSAVVLDLFCGSGSLGIEALSRGASKCFFVDNNKEILSFLEKNIDNLNIKSSSTIIKKDFLASLRYFYDNNIKFDIVVADPPYKLEAMSKVIGTILEYDLLLPGGLLVLEYSYDVLKEEYDNLILIKTKKYGNKYVSIYRKTKNNE